MLENYWFYVNSSVPISKKWFSHSTEYESISLINAYFYYIIYSILGKKCFLHTQQFTYGDQD